MINDFQKLMTHLISGDYNKAPADAGAELIESGEIN